MTSTKAEQLNVAPLHCEECMLSKHGQLCDPAIKAIVRASVAHDPTLDIPTDDPARTEAAENLLDSMIYKHVALAAGEIACHRNQSFYNQTATESPLAVMI